MIAIISSFVPRVARAQGEFKVAIGGAYDLQKNAVLLAGVSSISDEDEDFSTMRIMGSFSFPTTSFGLTFAASPFKGSFTKYLQGGVELGYFYKCSLNFDVYNKHLANSDTAFSNPKSSWKTTIVNVIPFVGFNIPIPGTPCAIGIQSNCFWWFTWLKDEQGWSKSKQWGSFHIDFTYHF